MVGNQELAATQKQGEGGGGGDPPPPGKLPCPPFPAWLRWGLSFSCPPPYLINHSLFPCCFPYTSRALMVPIAACQTGSESEQAASLTIHLSSSTSGVQRFHHARLGLLPGLYAPSAPPLCLGLTEGKERGPAGVVEGELQDRLFARH